MNNEIVNDLITLKKDIFKEISEHLPDTAKVRIHRLEYEFMALLHEVSDEYLKKTQKPDEENPRVKKINVENFNN